jgi:hypothetical protein
VVSDGGWIRQEKGVSRISLEIGQAATIWQAGNSSCGVAIS